MPKEYINSVKVGVQDALKSGVVAGYEMIDVKATLFDGSYHDVDSSEMAYKIAASMALKNGAADLGATILEPIMDVSIIVPAEYFGDVMGDISSRRGQIKGNEERSDGAPLVKRSEEQLGREAGGGKVVVGGG